MWNFSVGIPAYSSEQLESLWIPLIPLTKLLVAVTQEIGTGQFGQGRFGQGLEYFPVDLVNQSAQYTAIAQADIPSQKAAVFFPGDLRLLRIYRAR